MAYATKNHAKFLILYHLIFVGKYRKKLLAPLGEEVQVIRSALPHTFSLKRWKLINIIFTVWRRVNRLSPLSIVRRLKQESTYALWQRYESVLLPHFWKECTFWSDGYFCCTVGNTSQDVIRRYIETQG